MKIRKIESNVISFLDKASKAYGKMREEEFSQHAYTQLLENGTQSPIEDIFFIALKLSAFELSIPFNPYPEYLKEKNEVVYGEGIYSETQMKIGSYKVDFFITYKDKKCERRIIVELDGHSYHDKDKHQRSYEKARDRYLTKEGYQVFHFTGSDIVKDPFKAVFEVLSAIGISYEADNLDDHDPNNRLRR